jgi:hypothetical protein
MSVLSEDPLIINYANGNNFSEAARTLFIRQKDEWEMLAAGVESLKTVKVKSFQFGGFSIKAQFNPGRMTSTSAKVDDQSILERKCFLCSENLPDGQKGVLYHDEYIILCNPFPIFPMHFTLAHEKHKPQRIIDTFPYLLDLGRDLSEHYSVIYNGPRCGASAPDHLHFQAGNKLFMPIDEEFHLIKNEYGSEILDEKDDLVYAVDDGLRKFITIESTDYSFILKVFNIFYSVYSELVNAQDEPLMNLISFYESEYGWRIIIFLREKHRSTHYYKQGDEQILMSPAAIDLGGMCIFPRETDFENVTKENIEEIFKEVFVTKEILDKIQQKMIIRLKEDS